MERILVATSAAHLPPSLLRAPQVTGVLPFRVGGAGAYALILKSRAAFDEGLALVRPDVMLATPIQSETLGRPVDFVPEKAWVDVFIVGTFHKRTKDESKPIRLFGTLQLGGEETPILIENEDGRRFAVTRRTVRVPDGRPECVLVNPSKDPAETEYEHPDGFNFAAYNAGHPTLGRNLGAIAPGALFSLVLEGEEDPAFEAQIPERFPRVLVDPQDGDERSRIVEMTLDTLVLDLDKHEMELTWRGSWYRIQDPSEIDRVLVGWATNEEWDEEGFAGLYREMPHGHFEWAWELSDAEAGTPPPPLDEDELQEAKFCTLDSPTAPAPRLTIEEFAKIQSELNEARQPRAEIFKKHGTDDFRFGLESRAWTERMQEEVLTNPIEAPLATRYADALSKESDAYARSEEKERTLRQYAEVKHRMSTGDPSRVMRQAKLSLGEWIRWERAIASQQLDDPRVADELAELMTELRESHRLPTAKAGS